MASLLRTLVLGLTACAASACVPAQRVQPAARPIVGPDGLPTLHVSCGTDEGACYELAGRSCPTGYDIHPTRGSPGNFLVRCGAQPQPPSANVASTQTLAPSPYAIQETVQPWPQGSTLAPSPYAAPPVSAFPPLAPGAAPPPKDDRQDLGF
jgi:hypothetical protein